MLKINLAAKKLNFITALRKHDADQITQISTPLKEGININLVDLMGFSVN